MRQLFPIAVLLTLVATPFAAMAEPALILPRSASTGTAESVHVQPRGRTFAPNSAEDDAVQKQLTIFNATQALMDTTFDKKLTICRRCWRAAR